MDWLVGDGISKPSLSHTFPMACLHTPSPSYASLPRPYRTPARHECHSGGIRSGAGAKYSRGSRLSQIFYFVHKVRRWINVAHGAVVLVEFDRAVAEMEVRCFTCPTRVTRNANLLTTRYFLTRFYICL